MQLMKAYKAETSCNQVVIDSAMYLLRTNLPTVVSSTSLVPKDEQIKRVSFLLQYIHISVLKVTLGFTNTVAVASFDI